MKLNLACIVEGHGDEQAIPVLLRRLAPSDLNLHIPRPIRTGRYKLIKPRELARVIELAARQVQTPRAILVLVDAEDDCPARLGPDLLSQARTVRPDIALGVVLAKREFEAWFLAAFESLKSRRGLRDSLIAPADPESVRDAKGMLTDNMAGSRAYSETVDQPKLTAVFDMELARQRSPSFDKLWREVQVLFQGAQASEIP